ncbi:LXG domain-containing protein [Ureibacillus composti]|nr:LXG domain-containing protein [Ureibacillus composti]
MKVLDAEELHAGLKRNIEMLHRLEGEMQGIERAIKDLAQMEESLKGQGGKALRTFYAQCHLPFLQYFMTFKDNFIEILEQMGSALSSLEPDPSGFIEQSYLEVEVEQGMNQAQNVTMELTSETNAIMDEVSDIVSLPKLNDSEVLVETMNAKTQRNQTVNDLLEFDRTQTNALTVVENNLKIMSTWIGNIQHSMIAGLTDVNFSTPKWNLLTFMSLSNPLLSNQIKLNEIMRMLVKKSPQKNLQAFSKGMDQNISKVEETEDSQDNLDALYKAIANGEGITTTNYEAIEYMKEHNLMTNHSQIGPNGDYALTFEGMRKVVGGNGSGTPDGLAPYTILAADFFFEDIPTIFGPDATIDERIAAAATTLFKPAKVVDKLSDAANVADTVQDVAKVGKKVGNGKDTESVQDQTNVVKDNYFIGMLKGEKVHLKGVKVEEITYTKRLPEETAKLRKEFNSSVRKNFLKEFATDPVRVNYLKKAGISEADISRMKDGLNPKGWQVHHNLPLDDGGTNEFTNLVLIKNDPYHKAVTNEQNSLTRELAPKQSKIINWPMFEDEIYPPKHF